LRNRSSCWSKASASESRLSLSGPASFSFLRYIIHGIPEMIAYFIAGIAGGIISVAVIRHDFRSSNFKKIVLDSIDLVLIAVIVLLLAALIEVFITPALF